MANHIVEKARSENAVFLSEAESKNLLVEYGVHITDELLTESADDAVKFAGKTGYPVVLKGCGRTLLHKTELGLVRLDIGDENALRTAFLEMQGKLPDDADGILVSAKVNSQREFIIGMSIDPQFGLVVMLGLGGIFTETMRDVVFRVAPVTQIDVVEMVEEIKSSKLLGAVRGMPAVDIDALGRILIAVGKIGTEIEGITEIDINPVLFDDGKPVVADALIRVG